MIKKLEYIREGDGPTGIARPPHNGELMDKINEIIQAVNAQALFINQLQRDKADREEV